MAAVIVSRRANAHRWSAAIPWQDGDRKQHPAGRYRSAKRRQYAASSRNGLNKKALIEMAFRHIKAVSASSRRHAGVLRGAGRHLHARRLLLALAHACLLRQPAPNIRSALLQLCEGRLELSMTRRDSGKAFSLPEGEQDCDIRFSASMLMPVAIRSGSWRVGCHSCPACRWPSAGISSFVTTTGYARR